MRRAIILLCVALSVAGGAAGARAQEEKEEEEATTGAQPGEARVPLAQAAIARDAEGREALSGSLLTQALEGTVDAPVRNTRFVIRNRSPLFYNYVQGWATFYDESGIRCGEGLWKLEAFAPDERAEVDTPGLRLTCKPATWRLAATTLLTPASDVARPREAAPPAEGRITSAGVPPLEINVNGKTIPIQLGNPLEITVGKERLRIIVRPAP